MMIPDISCLPDRLITEGIEQLTVAHHIFVDSKAPWHALKESVQILKNQCS
jgi:tRNA A58 N-methylase Trm61